MRLPYNSGTVRVSSPFGIRTLNGVRVPHWGIDLVGSDKRVVAVCDGIVRSSTIYYEDSCPDDSWEWGNFVRVDDAQGNRYFYCHLSSRAVSVGQKIRAGDIIGIEGSTGVSTGNHLHFEVRNPSGVSVDPTPFIGIKNQSGATAAVSVTTPDYATLVCQKCGLEPHTKEYLNGWKWSADLWRKLWEAMR